MLKLDTEIFQSIQRQLLPYIEDEKGRKALLIPYFISYSNILSNIDWSGAPNEFSVRLIKQLWLHGKVNEEKQALLILLEALYPLGGVEDRAGVTDLMKKITSCQRVTADLEDFSLYEQNPEVSDATFINNINTSNVGEIIQINKVEGGLSLK